MKFRRMIGSILLLVILLLTVSGCKQYKGPYTFRQYQSNIEKIEICSYDSSNKTATPIVQLTDSEAKQLMQKLSAMECFDYTSGGQREYGEAIICIYYLDGEIEIIGLRNTGWIAPNGEHELSGYAFHWGEIKEVILNLVGEDDLPELR